MRELRERVVNRTLEERPERTVRERVREAGVPDLPDKPAAEKTPAGRQTAPAGGTAGTCGRGPRG